jgi:hypothetical protein
VIDELHEARRERFPREPEMGVEVLEATDASNRRTHDQERPALANDIKSTAKTADAVRVGDRTPAPDMSYPSAAADDAMIASLQGADVSEGVKRYLEQLAPVFAPLPTRA